jgi:hypothetical protein
MRISLLLGLGLATSACSSGSTVITGRIGDGFPSSISMVKVFQAATLVASTPVDPDGNFRIEVPSHVALTLRLVGDGYANVVMPHRSGSLDHTFGGAGGEIALGEVRFVGDATTTKYEFRIGPNDQCTHACHNVCVGDGGGGDFTDCDGGGGGTTTGGDGTIVRTAPSDDGTHMGDAVPEFDAPSCGGGGGGGGSGSGSGGSGSDGIVL